MSTSDEKKRFSARVKTDTLDKIEEYQDDNNLDNRSNAIEVLVAEKLDSDRERAQSRLELIRDGLPAGIVLSFILALLTGVFAIATAFTAGTAAATTPALISAAGAVLSIALVELAKRIDGRAAAGDEVEA